MKPDVLVSLAAPGSVDLVSAAKGQTEKRRRKAGLLKVSGRSTPVHVAREWTLAELGQAAMGVPEVPFLAACFSWAGSHRGYVRLHDALYAEALKLRRQHGWAFRISGTDGQARDYLPQLADLVLLEESQPAAFKACPALHASYLGITQELWDGKIEERYTHLMQTYRLWLSDAWRIMAPRLQEEWEE